MRISIGTSTKHLTLKSEIYYNLKSKYFLCSEADIQSVISFIAIRLRTKKAFLRDFTTLHMIVPTIACNSNCKYCQVSSRLFDSKNHSMDKPLIKRTIDIIMQSPADSIKIEIQGGEPLLRFDLVQYILSYALKQSIIKQKNVDFVICTNLTLVNREMLNVLKQYNVHISSSLDGNKVLHNLNRPLRSGESSFDQFIEKLELVQSVLGIDRISCLMTTTKDSLKHYKEIVDQYVSLGITSIFLRMLNPFGNAIHNADEVGYSYIDFVKFYKNAFEYIIELNKNGISISEEYASIVLKKILTPFNSGFVDLQSPSGLGISCALYNHDGEVYCSDEGRMIGEMGDSIFSIGNVNTHNYQEIFNSEKLKTIIKESIAESSLFCSTCALLPFCGTDPIRNWQDNNSFTRKSAKNTFCDKNKPLIEFILLRYHNADKATKEILERWARR